MKALILAAGLGTRMRPLTDHLPKPLLPVGGKPLIAHHLERLAAFGVREVVVNLSYRAQALVDFLGSGERWGVDLRLSREATPLETGGGILQAMTLLGLPEDEPLLVINGDVWTDYPLQRLPQRIEGWAHLVLVDNPTHHPEGDFGLLAGRVVDSSAAGSAGTYTFSGLSLIKPALLAGCQPGVFPLAPCLRRAIARGRVGGERYQGRWVDVGTPQRLAALDRSLGGRDYQEYETESL